MEFKNVYVIFRDEIIDELGNIRTMKMETFEDKKECIRVCKEYNENNDNSDVSFIWGTETRTIK